MLNRPAAQCNSGQVFQEANRTKQYSYLINGRADSVLLFTADPQNETLTIGGILGSNVLYKNIVTDEDGLQEISFMDHLGRLVLMRTLAANGKKADTYYCYDALDRMILAVPLPVRFYSWENHVGP